VKDPFDNLIPHPVVLVLLGLLAPLSVLLDDLCGGVGRQVDLPCHELPVISEAAYDAAAEVDAAAPSSALAVVDVPSYGVGGAVNVGVVGRLILAAVVFATRRPGQRNGLVGIAPETVN
jgi:hypothetical protein